MTPFASGAGWMVYHADAADLVALVGPDDHVVTDPPYSGHPSPGSHARKRRSEYEAADPVVIAALIARARSTVIVTGSTDGTMTILDRAPRARRILPILRRWNQPTKLDPWGFGVTLAHVFGARDRDGLELRQGYFTLPAFDVGRTRHIAEMPAALGAWLTLGIPGGRVIDPYAGSGALLVGARRHGLDVVAGDISERYCERIARRLQLESPALLPE